MDFSFIQYEKRGRVAILTLDRPERLNALGRQMIRERNEAMADFEADPECWVLILTGAGRAFCSGADLKEMSDQRRPGDPVTLLSPIRTTWKPTIAAVNGVALGGGFEAALECDIRIASSRARFSMAEPKRGIMPGSAAWLLPRLVGPSVARALMLTGEEIDAEEAHRIGLVFQVVEPQHLLNEAIRVAEQICDLAPLPVRALNRVSHEEGQLTAEDAQKLVTELIGDIMRSDDAREGISAFVDRRPPVWHGR